jgi:hypothetical protein
MITGMGIPRAKAVDPYPSCDSPMLLLTTERQDEDRKNGGSHTGIATNISLHLTAINATREQSVPVMQQTHGKKTAGFDWSEVALDREPMPADKRSLLEANFTRSTNGNSSVEGAEGNHQSCHARV